MTRLIIIIEIPYGLIGMTCCKVRSPRLVFLISILLIINYLISPKTRFWGIFVPFLSRYRRV